MNRYGSSVLAAALVFTLAACDDDDDMMTPVAATTFEVSIENVTPSFDFATSGVFNTPVGASAPGPLLPGGMYQFDVAAPEGSRLSFATMFVQSNDWFYAPDGAGIALWDGSGMQISGDVTDQLYLWDAGSEEDQEPGIGADQAPRQASANTGAVDDDTTVRLAADSWANIPATADVIRVMITPIDATNFRVTIENVSTDMTLSSSDMMTRPVPMAPGLWVVHTDDDPLFTVGQDERGEGLAAIAEDGDPSGLAMNVESRTGIAGPIAPGAFAVHTAPSVLFMTGAGDAGLGLEALAEDGDPSALAAAMAASADATGSGAFNTPSGAAGPAPAFPGESYSFQFDAVPGERLSFATMYVQSNDLFFAPSDAGLELFPGGTALNGDVTDMIMLMDSGTEVNEFPGIGLNQAPRQSGANVGAAEGGLVQLVDDGYMYPAVGTVVRVTIRPVS